MTRRPLWWALLPKKFQDRLEERFSAQGVISNTGWLAGDQVLRMVAGILVGAWVARHLGPGPFGLLNFAVAIVAITGSIGDLGIQSLVVRDLARSAAQKERLLATAFILRLVGSAAATTAALIIVHFLRPGDHLSFALVAILGLGMAINGVDVASWWFESQVQSKFTVIARNLGYLMFVTIRIACVLTDAPLVWFALATLAESVLATILLLIFYYRRQGRLFIWKYDPQLGKKILLAGLALLGTSILQHIHSRADYLMLASIIGDQSVGIYAVAMRIPDAFAFIPLAVVGSLFPSFSKLYNDKFPLFESRLIETYRFLTVVTLIFAVMVTLAGPWVLEILFGSAYRESGTPMILMAWLRIFLSLGVARSVFLLNAGYLNHYLLSAAMAVVCNILLNLFTIPRWGVTGAVASTCASSFVMIFVADLLNPKTRRNFFWMVRAVFTPWELLKRL